MRLLQDGWRKFGLPMITIINKNTTREEFITFLRTGKRGRRKGVDVKSFAGKLKLEEDPLEIQKRMRNGWR